MLDEAVGEVVELEAVPGEFAGVGFEVIGAVLEKGIEIDG